MNERLNERTNKYLEKGIHISCALTVPQRLVFLNDIHDDNSATDETGRIDREEALLGHRGNLNETR